MYYAFIKVSTLEYPRYIGDIQIDFPDFVEGDSLPDDYSEVIPTEKPEASSKFEEVREDFPVLIDGVWTQQWKKIELTQEELDRRRLLMLNTKQKLHNISDDDVLFLASKLRKLSTTE